MQGDTVSVPGMPWRSDNRGEPVNRLPPALGEHTDEVLAEWLHMHANDIEALKKVNAIFAAV